MPNYSIVLNDELLNEFYKFKHNNSYSVDTITKLLNLYKPHHITNIAQLLRLDIKDRPLLQQLASQSWKNDSLEMLLKHTKYKLVLTNETDCLFPNVDINSKSIESNFTSTYYKQINRDNVKKHIQLLCETASNIFIYDKYFKKNWDRTKKIFQDLMPKKRLTFFYKENHFDQTHISEIKSIHAEWLFRIDSIQVNHEYLHDRYLIIDNKIEIILTSGFDNLFDETTDLTYIIRDIST